MWVLYRVGVCMCGFFKVCACVCVCVRVCMDGGLIFSDEFCFLLFPVEI